MRRVDGDSPGEHCGIALVATEMALQLLKGHPQHALHVAHKLVHIALAPRLADDVPIVVIPQCAAQLLVVHVRLVLPHTPLASHLFWVVQLKLPLSPGPHNAVLVLSVREELKEELPQLN